MKQRIFIGLYFLLDSFYRVKLTSENYGIHRFIMDCLPSLTEATNIWTARDCFSNCCNWNVLHLQCFP